MDNIGDIEVLLSSQRVSAYKAIYGNEWLEGYKKDVTLGESFYKKLHYVEIFLRNRIDNEFRNVFGNGWLLGGIIFAKKEYVKIQRTIEVLSKEHKKIEHQNILSNLSFGFWTGLFHGFYHDTIWTRKHNLLKSIFPYLMAHERSLKRIESELDAIRKLRNRVFHFEPLINQNTEESIALIERYTSGVSG